MSAGRLARLRARLATAAFVAVLAFVTAASVRSQWRFATHKPLVWRWQVLHEGRAARLERSLGREYPLYAAVVAHAPPGSLVALRAPMNKETFLGLVRLESALFPTRIDYFHALAALYRDPALPDRAPRYVLDLRPATPFPGRERCTRLAVGDGFALWRLADAAP